MEKLTLKQIAPYLPYEVKMCDEEEKTYFPTLIGIDGESIITTLPRFPYTYKCGISELKPILRPLSDLTKEIEVNGEKFVPFDVIANDEEYAYLEDDNIWVNDMFYSQILTDLAFIPYGVIQKLLEWHFDFQGLIQQNKAVDINTLNK